MGEGGAASGPLSWHMDPGCLPCWWPRAPLLVPHLSGKKLRLSVCPEPATGPLLTQGWRPDPVSLSVGMLRGQWAHLSACRRPRHLPVPPTSLGKNPRRPVRAGRGSTALPAAPWGWSRLVLVLTHQPERVKIQPSQGRGRGTPWGPWPATRGPLLSPLPRARAWMGWAMSLQGTAPNLLELQLSPSPMATTGTAVSVSPSAPLNASTQQPVAAGKATPIGQGPPRTPQTSAWSRVHPFPPAP